MAARGRNITQGLVSNDPAIKKTAEDGYNEILQTHVRGDCIVDKFIEPVEVGPEDLDGQVDSIKPMRWEEMDTRSPGAMSMAFDGASVNYYMHIPRFMITYTRLASFRFIADVSDLLTYRGDITQLYHDYMIKDIIDQKDRGFLLPVRVGCGNKNDTTSTRAQQTGAVGYTDIGPVSREATKAVGKSLAATEGNLDPQTILVNNSTVWDFIGPDHDELGGTKAEEIFFNGFHERTWGGLTLVSTAKHRLIEDGDGYIFAEEEKLGRNDVLRPVTFINRSEGWFVDMQCWTEVGGALPNFGAFARFDLSGSFQGWHVEDHASAS